MPNRILKESVCTSDNVDKLTAFQETFFYRLIVNCDDYGRMDAREEMLASRLFPLRRDMKLSQVKDAVQALAANELIILYEVDGKPYLQMKTWENHQQVRAKKSKYPSPNDGICKQLQSDVSKCSRNPIQSESNPNPNPNTNTKAETEKLFDRFWSAYPRHEAKATARAEFDKLKPDEELLETMLAAIDKQKKSAQWQENGGQYIPHPRTWLHQRRWEDEVTENRPAGKTVIAQQYSQRDYSGEDEAAMQWMIDAIKAEKEQENEGRLQVL